jgi:hypothetical protein
MAIMKYQSPLRNDSCCRSAGSLSEKFVKACPYRIPNAG